MSRVCGGGPRLNFASTQDIIDIGAIALLVEG
jgi:hypothetical protein